MSRQHCILYKENPRADFVRITDINQNAFLLPQHLMPTKQIYRQKSLGIPGKCRPAALQTLAKLDARLAKERKKKGSKCISSTVGCTHYSETPCSRSFFYSRDNRQTFSAAAAHPLDRHSTKLSHSSFKSKSSGLLYSVHCPNTSKQSLNGDRRRTAPPR